MTLSNGAGGSVVTGMSAITALGLGASALRLTCAVASG